jgi:hypothetical protein
MSPRPVSRQRPQCTGHNYLIAGGSHSPAADQGDDRLVLVQMISWNYNGAHVAPRPGKEQPVHLRNVEDAVDDSFRQVVLSSTCTQLPHHYHSGSSTQLYTAAITQE